MSMTNEIFDELNQLYDSKKGGIVPNNILSELLDKVSSVYNKSGKLDDSFLTHLPSDTRMFRSNHLGLSEVAKRVNEEFSNGLAQKENSPMKVMQ